MPVEPRQFWIGTDVDAWLTECEFEGIRRGRRGVVTRSAAVRLALERLKKSMTSSQVAEIIANQEPPRSGPGRPRR